MEDVFFPTFQRGSATFREKNPGNSLVTWWPFSGWWVHVTPSKVGKVTSNGSSCQWGESLKTLHLWPPWSKASWKGSHNPTSLRGLNEPWLLTTYQMGWSSKYSSTCLFSQCPARHLPLCQCQTKIPQEHLNLSDWDLGFPTGGLVKALGKMMCFLGFFCIHSVFFWPDVADVSELKFDCNMWNWPGLWCFFSIVLSENRIQTFKRPITLQ